MFESREAQEGLEGGLEGRLEGRLEGGMRELADERRRHRLARLEAMRIRRCGRMSTTDANGAADPDSVMVPVGVRLRDATEELARLVGSNDLQTMSGEDLRDVVEVLERGRRQVTAALAAGLRQLHLRGREAGTEGLTAPAWLASSTRGSKQCTSRSLRIGEVLERLPAFAASIAAGDLSDDHALAIDAVANPRNIDDLVAHEAVLHELALASTFTEFRRGVRRIAALLDEDGAEPDCRERDEASVTRAHDGALLLRATFTGHTAATVEHALRTEVDRQWRIAQEEQRGLGVPVPSHAVLRARALAHLIRAGLGTDPTATSAPRTDATVAITVDQSTADAITTSTADGEPLDPATAATLTCDAHLHPVLMRTGGVVIWSGRSARFVNPALRRSLVARDRGCVFPGCGAPPGWCDAHHVVPWEDGGATDPTNCCLLCRAHHGLAHSKGWALSAERSHGGDVEFWWTTPGGRRRRAEHVPV